MLDRCHSAVMRRILHLVNAEKFASPLPDQFVQEAIAAQHQVGRNLRDTVRALHGTAPDVIRVLALWQGMRRTDEDGRHAIGIVHNGHGVRDHRPVGAG